MIIMIIITFFLSGPAGSWSARCPRPAAPCPGTYYVMIIITIIIITITIIAIIIIIIIIICLVAKQT